MWRPLWDDSIAPGRSYLKFQFATNRRDPLYDLLIIIGNLFQRLPLQYDRPPWCARQAAMLAIFAQQNRISWNHKPSNNARPVQYRPSKWFQLLTSNFTICCNVNVDYWLYRILLMKSSNRNTCLEKDKLKINWFLKLSVTIQIQW